MQWFGEQAFSRACADLEHVATPVGADCLYCEEPIEEGQFGFLLDSITAAGAERRPQHGECFMRTIMGSVAHLEGRCSCRNPGVEDGDDPPGFSKRQAALAVWDWLGAREWAAE